MGLIGKGREEAAQSRGGTTVIAEGTRLSGELSLEGKLHIDGRIDGIVHCRGDVSVGSKGHFQGDLRAGRLMVSGHVEGKIDCEGLEIVNGGRVYGKVATEDFVIEPGGQFVGESLSREEEEIVALPRMEQDGSSALGPATPGEESDKTESATAANTG